MPTEIDIVAALFWTNCSLWEELHVMRQPWKEIVFQKFLKFCCFLFFGWKHFEYTL